MSTWDGGLFIRISNNVDRYMTSYEMTTYLSSEKRLKKATNGGDIINCYMNSGSSMIYGMGNG